MALERVVWKREGMFYPMPLERETSERAFIGMTFGFTSLPRQLVDTEAYQLSETKEKVASST